MWKMEDKTFSWGDMDDWVVDSITDGAKPCDSGGGDGGVGDIVGGVSRGHGRGGGGDGGHGQGDGGGHENAFVY